jgi:tetratricopeptide (TPR) repeat protein
MKCWRVVGVVVASVFLGCAVSPYRQAETYISQKEYKQALQIYIKALNPRMQNGKRVIGYDPEAMTGVGAVLWHMKRYNTAVRVLAQVVRKTPQYGKALYYLGGSYESLNKLDKAGETYRRYALLDQSDPYREVLRWRSDWSERQLSAQNVRKAAADEASINVASLPRESVAVLYFQNLSKSSWSPLQKGLAQLIIDDLSCIEPLKVAGREKVQRTLEAMGWTAQQMAQDSRSVQVGKLLGARTLVKGSFKILPNQRIELSYGSAFVSESRTPEYVKLTGGLQELIPLEKRMVHRLLADMGITLNAEQERLISSSGTRDFRAFFYTCAGLNDMDSGKFESAQGNFKRALAIDPDFFLAQDWLADPAVYRAAHAPQFASMNLQIERLMTGAGPAPGPAVAGAPYAVSTSGRLQELGALMDAGFLPGNDSRDLGDSDFSGSGGTQPVPGTLSAAPAPPYTPARWVLPGPPSPPSRR